MRDVEAAATVPGLALRRLEPARGQGSKARPPSGSGARPAAAGERADCDPVELRVAAGVVGRVPRVAARAP